MSPAAAPDIVTLTLNPAIDQTVTVEHLAPGHVHRASAVRYDAGGKGVNVAACLADWGLKVAAAGLLGAANAAPFEALFAAKSIADRFRRVPGETRTNIKLLDRSSGETTDVNLPGFPAETSALAEVEADLTRLARPDGLVVLSGSLPEGAPPDIYARLVARLRGEGARVVLDTSGLPLTHALAGTPPTLVKPNRRELEVWAGRPLDDRADLLAVAKRLCAAGITYVVVSLGADGALFVSADEALHAMAPEVTGGSSVGAGDAMVAGLVAGLHEGRSLEGLARLGTAFAVGKLGLPGANLPAATVIETIAAAVAIQPAAIWAAAHAAIA
ncbi:1-phosphofructokinase [Ancylobacter sp. SL191]|uniref:1-phosphofructokinase n=1 Tax=Ancylobacter sp. SL191 TaxID=2995166 RepID=UPI00226EFC90|nr:1-phosphofructokinase [Ancylobacter sp. SL191]WAC27586.1 1-phosphofructokinase [Ancylobacter sp. SL191]